MLKSLHIENFKAIRDADDIPLAPVTLIYGPNSGGKSSVIQALLLLKQSMDAGRFTARGSLTDLGSFHSCVWQHDVQKPLRLGVTVRGTRAASSEESEFDASWVAGPDTSLRLTFRSRKAEPSEPTRVRLAGCRYRVRSKGDEALDVRLERDPLASQVLEGDSRFRFSGERSRGWLRTQAQQRGLPHAAGDLSEYGVFCRGGLLPHVIARRTAVDVLVDKFFGDAFAAPDPPPPTSAWSGQPLSVCRAQVDGILDGLRYIGPLRARATRTYSPLDNGADWVGSTGENAPQALLQGLVRNGSKELSQLFAHWLEQLDIPYRFHVRSVGDQVLGDGIRTTLVDQRTKVSVGLTDVGSGVGQVLPLLVQAAFGDAQTMCVEQPELHLHPRAQAALGDVLLESAGLMGKKEPAKATQWVVETHSETLLLRIKRRIREKKVDPLDVSVLYVEPSKSGSSVIRLRLNEGGDFIDDWPRGFFEEAFNEVFP